MIGLGGAIGTGGVWGLLGGGTRPVPQQTREQRLVLGGEHREILLHHVDDCPPGRTLRHERDRTGGLPAPQPGRVGTISSPFWMTGG